MAKNCRGKKGWDETDKSLFFFINEQHDKDMQPMISCLRCNYEYRSSRSENGHHRQQLPLVTTSHSYP